MRILIIKLGSLGDIIHTLPAASLLRKSFPNAWISWVVDSRSSSILRDSPAIDQLIELDTRTWNADLLKRRTVADVLDRLAEIKGNKPPIRSVTHNGGAASHVQNSTVGPADIAIDFQGLIKSGVIAMASRARRRIGCETSDLREKACSVFLTEQVPTAHVPHIIAKNVAIARAVAARYGDTPSSGNGDANKGEALYDFPLSLDTDHERYVRDLTGEDQRHFAMINPGSAWRTKLWPPTRYAELADWLELEYGIQTLVTYGPGEEPLAESVVLASKTRAARIAGPTLQQFVALARRASLFVGPDTGPLHLAAACGTPIVGLYGPTSPIRNGPFHSPDVTVSRDLWCRTDCHRRRCWHWECMDISVEDVKRAVSMRLGSSDQPDTRS
jgi:heptosyltransferase-1